MVAFAMMVTMLPANAVKAAQEEKSVVNKEIATVNADQGMDINIHYYDSEKAYEGKVYLQYWDNAEDATITTTGEAITVWDSATAYPLASEAATEGEDWYGLNIKGKVVGFQFLNVDGSKATGSVYNKALENYAGDLYYKDKTWYTSNPVKNTDAEPLKLVEAKDEYYVVGDIVSTKWSLESNSQLSKNEDETYSITLKAVAPGSYQFKVLKDPANFSWDYAWGGTGAGGNFELTIEKISDVTVTIDPTDSTKQITVKTTKLDEAIVNLKSPVYATDGAITFNYVGATGEAVIVKGSFNGWQNVAMNEQATETTGTSIYTTTVKNVTGAGIYTYGIAKLDEEGQQKDWIGDPLNNCKYGTNAAFVRNPVVSEIGLTSIYAPEGKDYKVYYKAVTGEAIEASVTGGAIEIGDKITTENAEELGYKLIKMDKDGQFTDGMYSVKIADGKGVYQYFMVDDKDSVIGDPYNFEKESEVGQAVKTFAVTKFDEELVNLKSPVVNKDRSVTFNYLDASAASDTAISVAGSFNGWGDAIGKDVMALKNAEKGIWSTTIKGFNPGVYAYKLVIGKDGWIADPLAALSQGDNSAFAVAGLALKEGLQVEKNNSLTLPKKANLFEEGSLTAKEADVEFSLKEASPAGISLKDGVLSVSDECTAEAIALEMTNGTYTEAVSVEVVEKMYSYTIHYYAEDGTDYDATDLWVWEAGGKPYNTGYTFNEEPVTDEVGRTWATAVYSYPTDSINFISRSKGMWADAGGWQEETRNITVPEGKDGVEVWVLKGNPLVFTEWAEKFQEPEKRYIIIEYDRPAKDYKDWNVYTWNSGASASLNTANYFEEINGKYVATIEIGQKTSSIGFLIRYGVPKDGEDWIKDVEGDRSITAPLDQKVIKVRATQGSLKLDTLPYNTGCELQVNDHKMVYYYRDDDLFKEGTLSGLASVEVEIDGQKQKMTYDAENERYEYVVENPAEKTYEYRFFATDKEGNVKETKDLFNDKATEDGTKSIIEYRDINVKVSGTVSASAIDYNESAVLAVKAEVENGEKLEVTDCYADLTELGGKQKTPVETELMEVSIGVNDKITAGEKKIPITVVDQYGKRHTGETTVTVKTRTTVDGDFDWDEAVIYFMVTDRFNDGNKDNNDAYGVGDYDTSDKGGSSYHGGDFAGVTQKLDYLKELGINTIWITPVVENILEDQHDETTDTATYGYHGYWASNFEKLNKHLGTIEEFHTLIDEAHERGMKIMVDIVANHAGYGTKESEAFKGMFRDEDVENNDILGPLSGLPDFATERADVREKIVQWQTNWVSEIAVTDKGNTIDFFRVDTVKHVESTTWAALKNALTKVAPTFKMIGEYAGAGYVDDFGYLNTGKMDSLLDFGFNDMALKFVKGSLESIEKELEARNTTISNTGTLGSFLGSHDEEGFKYSLIENAGYTEAEAQALSNVAAALQITAKGQPVIYYGEEIGLSGANNWPYQENRYDMIFDNLTAEQSATLTHYQKLLKVRNQYSKLFAKGTRTQVAGSDKDGYMVFSRDYNDESVVVGLNVTNETKEVTFSAIGFAGKTVEDLYSGTKYQADKDGVVKVTIPAASKGGTIMLAVDKTDISTPTPTPTNVPTQTPTQVPTNVPTQTPTKKPVVPTAKPNSSIKVNGTKATISVNPSTTTVTGKTAVITAKIDAAKTNAALAKASKKVTATVSVSSSTVKAQLIKSNVNTVNVKVVIPTSVLNNSKISSLNVTVGRDILSMAKAMKKSLSYTIVNDKGTALYQWDFSSSDLSKNRKNATVNISVKTLAASKVSAAKKALKKDKNNSKGVVIRLSQKGTLPTTARVKVYVGQQQGLKNNKTAYVYYLNSKTGMFEQLPTTSAKMVNGYITIRAVKGGDYVVLPKKANSKAVTTLAKQIKVSAKTTVKAKKTTTVKVTLPVTMKKLTSISTSACRKYLPSGVLGAKVSYKSSNKKIATVNKNGTVTGKKKGKVTITTTIQLSNRSKVTIKKTIRVK